MWEALEAEPERLYKLMLAGQVASREAEEAQHLAELKATQPVRDRLDIDTIMAEDHSPTLEPDELAIIKSFVLRVLSDPAEVTRAMDSGVNFAYDLIQGNVAQLSMKEGTFNDFLTEAYRVFQKKTFEKNSRAKTEIGRRYSIPRTTQECRHYFEGAVRVGG